MGSWHKEQLPKLSPAGGSGAEAAAAQLIELGRSAPATRAPPAAASPPVPGAAGACWGPRERMEGRRPCRLSPCPGRSLLPKTIALSRGLRVALGARDPQLDYDAVINGTAERELAWPSFAHLFLVLSCLRLGAPSPPGK